jgi:hypothetical protein
MRSTVRWYGPQVTRRVREQMKRRLVKAGQLAVRTVRRNIERRGPPASRPGEFPHRVSGELWRSVGMRLDRRSLSVSIVATAPYAAILETRRSFLRRTLREIRPQLRTIILGSGGGSGHYRFTE